MDSVTTATSLPDPELRASGPAPGTAPATARPLVAPLVRDDREIVIRPRRGWVALNWDELIRGRELLYFLALRDVKVRYKQTTLGVAWAVLQPLATMVIFTLIFGRFAGIPSEGVPYAVHVFAGLIPWALFASGLTAASQSLLQHQAMLTKIYFPRLYLPTATLGPFLVDAAVSSVLYGLVLAIYRVVPSWQVVYVPALMALTVMLTLGSGYLLAALIVRYRDFRHVVPFLIQILMFASPVIYPVRMLPKDYRWILLLNPLSGLIEAFRSSVLGTPWDLPGLAASVAITLLVLVTGLFYFRRTERLIADIA